MSFIQICYIKAMDWRIVYYSDTEGNIPVRNFIDAQSIDAQVKIVRDIELLRELALDLHYPYVVKIGKTGIRELRIHHSSDYYRIFYFTFTGRMFVLLHAFLKKTRRTPIGELEIAIKRMNDYRIR